VKRSVILFACLFAAATSLRAQAVDAKVCDILANPQSYDGKIVRIKGTVIAGFEEFAIKDASCASPGNLIWLAYPEGTKGSAGPVASVQLQLAANSPGQVDKQNRAAVKLDKNKDFKQFDALLATPYAGTSMCLGCGKYTVTATLTGRLDGVKTVGVTRDEHGKFVGVSGFGNMSRYAARLVLQSVAEVSSQEIDYSKAAVATKDDVTQKDSGGDQMAAAMRSPRAFPPGSAPYIELQRAVGAFGGPGEDNGVSVGFGVANEIRKGDGDKGSDKSPDGLLLHCTFAMDRLKGDALSRALAHEGVHIADVRQEQPRPDYMQDETRAWQVTVLSALSAGQKTLTMPGGYVVWNAVWTPDERVRLMAAAISEFLEHWAA
jgi:hypothetical protein